MLLALQPIKMPFSRPENGIFFLRKAVHLTSICIMRLHSDEERNVRRCDARSTMRTYRTAVQI